MFERIWPVASQPDLIAVVGALGLNILVGYTGQISIGHGAFMSVGAYTAANLAVRLGLPFWITLPAGGLMAALIGARGRHPILRIKGLYLAITTLAANSSSSGRSTMSRSISGGAQASIQVPRPSLFGIQFEDAARAVFLAAVLRRARDRATMNLVRSRSAAPSSRSATRTSPPRSSVSTSSATSCWRSRSRHSTRA